MPARVGMLGTQGCLILSAIDRTPQRNDYKTKDAEAETGPKTLKRKCYHEKRESEAVRRPRAKSRDGSGELNEIRQNHVAEMGLIWPYMKKAKVPPRRFFFEEEKWGEIGGVTSSFRSTNR